jgi:glutathione S-transferase
MSDLLIKLRAFYENAETDECLGDIRDAIEELERLYAERRWIPVSEEVPEDREEVLGWQTWVENEGWPEGVFVCHRGTKPGEWYGEEGQLPNITHWMPLPPPPCYTQTVEK